MRHTTALLLAGCAAGLSCSLLAAPLQLPPAQAASEKVSPFAGAKDETSLVQLDGTKAAGSKKNSPFAGAKESDAATHTDLQADRTRLWWLVLPVGLAALSYLKLRSGEGEGAA